MSKNKLTPNTISLLKSLESYGYKWNYENYYIEREISIIKKFEIYGYYESFNTKFSGKRSKAGGSYSIEFYFNNLPLFYIKSISNQSKVFYSYVQFSKIMNKIKNVSIKFSKRVSWKGNVFIFLSCEEFLSFNKYFLIFKQELNSFDFLEKINSENLDELINQYKLIYSL